MSNTENGNNESTLETTNQEQNPTLQSIAPRPSTLEQLLDRIRNENPGVTHPALDTQREWECLVGGEAIVLGSRVEALWKHPTNTNDPNNGSWYTGCVVEIFRHLNKRTNPFVFTVLFDDGDIRINIPDDELHAYDSWKVARLLDYRLVNRMRAGHIPPRPRKRHSPKTNANETERKASHTHLR